MTGEIAGVKLYIPIWFYSNRMAQNVIITKKALYIPIWFYSNFSLAGSPINTQLLYIPIWFYSNAATTVNVITPIKTLHSNLVLF